MASFILTAAAVASTIPTLTGIVSYVFDGDTLAIGPNRIRLEGLDAPELSEPYGDDARDALKAIAYGKPVRCNPTGATSHARVVARCYLSTGEDIAQILISYGVALDCAHFSGGRYRRDEPVGVRNRLKNKGYC